MIEREQLDDYESQIPKQCQALNEAVLLCHDEHKDWRKCQELLIAFRECISLVLESEK